MHDPPALLIVDDDADFRAMLDLHFASRGYQVATAATGNEALQKAFAHNPDIVLLDIGLPDIGGLSVLLALKLSRMDCRVIMLSANGDNQLAKNALLTGAKDFLAKPIELKALDAEVGFQLSAANGQRPL